MKNFKYKTYKTFYSVWSKKNKPIILCGEKEFNIYFTGSKVPFIEHLYNNNIQIGNKKISVMESINFIRVLDKKYNKYEKLCRNKKYNKKDNEKDFKKRLKKKFPYLTDKIIKEINYERISWSETFLVTKNNFYAVSLVHPTKKFKGGKWV